MTIGRSPSASMVQISIEKRSFDSLYWGRYPQGDKPGPPGTFVAAAQADSAAHGALNTSIRLVGSAVAGALAAAALGGGSSTRQIKWNSGPYFAQAITTLGGNVTTASSLYASVLNDLAGIAPYPKIIGYRVLTTLGFWARNAANDNSAAFAVIDGLLTRAAQMTPPRHLYFTLQPNIDTSSSFTTPAKNYEIPNFILIDPDTYGPALGITDPNGHGGYYIQASGGYGLNVCNANCQQAMIQIMQNVADRYDDPNGGAIVNGVPINSLFEGIKIVEDSNWTPSLGAGHNTGLTYVPFTAGLKTVLSGMVAAFKHTNIGMETDTNGPMSNQADFCLWCVKNRVVISSADVFDEAYFSGDPTFAKLQQGMKCLFGMASSGIPDQRPLCRPHMDVQIIELSNPPGYHGALSAGAASMATAMLTRYQASHYFFSKWGSGTYGSYTIPASNQFVNAAPILSGISTVSSYPPNYP